jgi:hypothetical protein
LKCRALLIFGTCLMLFDFANAPLLPLVGQKLAAANPALDSVGAGILGSLTPLVVADLMRGTARYNLALGAVATVQGAQRSALGAELTKDEEVIE